MPPGKLSWTEDERLHLHLCYIFIPPPKFAPDTMRVRYYHEVSWSVRTLAFRGKPISPYFP